jgi:hypothetical protein
MRPGSDWPVMRALYPVQLWVSAGSGLTGGQGFKSAQTGNVLISAAGRPRRRRRRVSQARAAVVPSTGTGWALAHNAACRVLRKAAGGSPVPPRIGKQRIRQVISRGGGRHPWIPARARRAGDDGNAVERPGFFGGPYLPDAIKLPRLPAVRSSFPRILSGECICRRSASARCYTSQPIRESRASHHRFRATALPSR